MPNAVTTEKLQQLAALAATKGLGVRITSDDRSYADQSTLASSSNPYPVATPGTSQHEYGFAFDAVPVPDTSANRKKLGALAAKVGLVYGGSSDPVHYQLFSRKDWSTILQFPSLLDAFTAKKQMVTYKGVKFPATIPGLTPDYQERPQQPSPAGGITLPSPNSGGSATYNPSLAQLIQNIWDTITGGGSVPSGVTQNLLAQTYLGSKSSYTLTGGFRIPDVGGGGLFVPGLTPTLGSGSSFSGGGLPAGGGGATGGGGGGSTGGGGGGLGGGGLTA